MRTLISLLLISTSICGYSYQVQDSLDIMIGQMIMIGIGDFNEANSKEFIFEEIKDGKAGGVVLYEKNLLFEKPKSELAKLVGALQKNAPTPLFVSIDE
ncbi:MAG: glycoside hydrolase family 3 protein, partial [Bacteroidota bacterium]